MPSQRSHADHPPLRGRRPRAGFAGVLALALAFVVHALPASAQPAPTPEEVQQAQARWNEGKAAFDAGNFEAARVAFKQAYTVFPHPAFLQNLGESELRTGRFVEAARHFSSYLRQPGPIPAAQRELATKSLKRAAERLGAIVVESDVAGAEVKVDDDVVGKTPLDGAPWYVEPGKHAVVLRKDGYLDGTQSVDVAKGPPRTVTVSMRPTGAGTSPAAAPPPAEPAPAAAVSTDLGSVPRSSSRDARTYVVIGGAGLTVAAVVVGTVFAVKVGSDTDRLDELNGGLAAAQPTRIGRGCVPEYDAVGVPIYTPPADTCASLADTAQTRRDHQNLRNASFIAAGILGAATVATYLLWPRSGSVAVAPQVGPGRAGVGVIGTF